MWKNAVLLVALAACSGSDAPTQTSEPIATPTATQSTAKDWRTRVAEDLAAMPAALRTELQQLQPSTTRAQFLRFTSKAIHDPRAASVFLDRLANGGESEGVRAALADALPRTGGLYADAVHELLATERSVSVRAAYVHTARRAPAGQAQPILERGLVDKASEVQAEAARAAASHADGAKVAVALRAALGAADPSVRSEAARTLGILKIAAAHDELVARLGDASPDVRLEALRAIDRIEPGKAKTLPLAQLANDSDPRIVALVARLTDAGASQ